MTDREAIKMALDVIIELYNDRNEKCEQNKELFVVADKVIAALETALAQPEPPFKLSDEGADANIVWGLEPKGSGMVVLHQPEQKFLKHAVIAGVLFDFMGWLTSRQERLVLSASDEASPAVKVIEEFAKMRGLSLDDAKVKDWQDMTASPRKEWVGLTDEEIEETWGNTPMMFNARDGGARKVFARAIEAKLKEKNT